MPNDAAAIITGTMASPSRPSVRLTALPAETMTKPPKTMKNRPRSMLKSLRKGKAIEEPKVEPCGPELSAVVIMK
ncbi:hypothetical protein D3C87_2053100 [compost metagenome]